MRVLDREEILGKKFGMLTVIKLSRIVHTTRFGKPIGYTRYYLCSCDCGGSTIVRDNHLKYDKTPNVPRSCGCARVHYMHTPKWKERSIRIGTAFRRCLDQYKANAKNRNLEWDLTDDQFREITQSPCSYTGEMPHTVKKTRCDTYVYNGIDRVDNTKGYTFDNCVPCCHEINLMKLDLTLSRFLELCKKVSERNPPCPHQPLIPDLTGAEDLILH